MWVFLAGGVVVCRPGANNVSYSCEAWGRGGTRGAVGIPSSSREIATLPPAHEAGPGGQGQGVLRYQDTEKARILQLPSARSRFSGLMVRRETALAVSSVLSVPQTMCFGESQVRLDLPACPPVHSCCAPRPGIAGSESAMPSHPPTHPGAPCKNMVCLHESPLGSEPAGAPVQPVLPVPGGYRSCVCSALSLSSPRRACLPRLAWEPWLH